ncbi:MAG TPA: acyloxyacyl hydrolase [Thermoanaerobaculia bacterium]|nr:acyloxyacyl hydrolase [Thermoanaerobaculia bacterium]
MKRMLVLFAAALCVSVPAFAGFNGPMETSIALVGGKSMNGVHGQGTFASLHFDFSRAFREHTELTWGVQPWLIEQPSHFFVADGKDNENAFALHFTLGLRHHFGSASANVRPFVELGSGPMFSSKKVPATTSRINFDSYGTAGVTFHGRQYLGFRFQHISNAGIVADRNPGFNIGSIVFGIRLAR